MSNVEIKSYMSCDDAKRLTDFSREAIRNSAEARIQLEQANMRNQELVRQNQQLYGDISASNQALQIAKGEKDQLQFDLDARHHLSRRQNMNVVREVQPSLFKRIPFKLIGVGTLILLPNLVAGYLLVNHFFAG